MKKGLPFTGRRRTERETALGRNRIPFGYKVEMSINHPSGDAKETGFERALLQE